MRNKLNTRAIFHFIRCILNKNVQKIYHNDVRVTSLMSDRSFLLYDGKQFLEKKISNQMFGLRLGELVKTRATFIHENKKNKKKDKQKKNQKFKKKK